MRARPPLLDEALPLVAQILADAREAARRAKGSPVTLCLQHPTLAHDVEIEVGQDYSVSPQIRRALRALPGVVEVEEV